MINMSGAKGESTEILTQLKKENLNAPVEPKDESCMFEDKGNCNSILYKFNSYF